MPHYRCTGSNVFFYVAQTRKERDKDFLWPILAFEKLEEELGYGKDCWRKRVNRQTRNDQKIKYGRVKKHIMDQLLKEGESLRKQIDKEAKRIVDVFVKPEENPQKGEVPLTKLGDLEEPQCDDEFKGPNNFTEKEK